MYLKSIELAGFKSFGKKSQLNFTAPISSIVGPNGSGKSNVAEAFRFVLGEQSVKSLRGKRTEDLIFNGAKDSPRANRASVKVVFDNSRRMLNLDFDEVSIERVIHRDSVSEYFINGSAVRLKDIIELLAQAHIGASGHHIISQGEADKILNANLRERREMIEDALGLKIYQYKKDESRRKLEKTEENVKSVESLRRELAPHLKFLKKQVEKIEKTAEMRQELKGLYREYFKREDIYLKHEESVIAEEKREPQEALKRLEAELREAKSILEKSDSKDVKSDKLISLESSLSEVRGEKDLIMREIGRLEGEISSLERLLRKYAETRHSNNTKMVELSAVENLSKSVSLEIDEALNTTDINVLKNFFTKIKSLINDFVVRNRAEENASEEKDLEAELGQLKQNKNAEEARFQEKKDLENKLVLEYQTLQDGIEKEKDTNRDAEKAVFRIMAEENEIRGRLKVLEAREATIIALQMAFKQELSEAGILAGLEAVRFADLELADTHDGITSEARTLQDDRRRQIERIKIRIEDSGIGGGEDVMKEYQETSERDTFLMKELEDLVKSAASLQTLITELDEKITVEFKEGVRKINEQFAEFFRRMFGGGQASLTVVKEKKKKRSDTDLLLPEGEEYVEEESAEEGVEIEVNLPQKKIKGLMMLSGGERALTSIALLFAMSQVNPPPFIILDETDAALDEANSKKYSDMIESLSEYSQLILITHNRETMSRAGVIYGVTMGGDGVSKLLSIQFEEAVKVAK